MSNKALEKKDSRLDYLRAQVSRPALDFGTIKLVNVKSELSKTNKKGSFILSKKGVDGEKSITDLGETPKVGILKRRHSYSQYDTDNNELMAWTNEIDGFTPTTPVHLATKKSGQVSVENMDWLTFKNRKNSGDFGKLKYRQVLYVCFGPPVGENVHRFFLSNASATGVEDGQKSGDFQKPLDGSFKDYEKQVSKMGISFPETICELGSKYLEENMYYLTTFKLTGTTIDYIDLALDLDRELKTRYQKDWLAEKEQSQELPDFVDIPTINYTPSISVEEVNAIFGDTESK